MRYLIGLLMALLLSPQVWAEGIPAKRPYQGIIGYDTATPVVDWTGNYVGGHLNYDPGNDSWQVGGQLESYKQWQSGLVLGGVIDATYAWDRSHRFLAEVNEECLPSTTGLQWHGSARLLVGFSTGVFLPFITAGWALGQADTEVEGLGNSRDFVNGLVYSGGVAVRLGPNLVAKAEYAQYKFGELDGTGVNLDQDMVKLSVNWKF